MQAPGRKQLRASAKAHNCTEFVRNSRDLGNPLSTVIYHACHWSG